MGIDIRKYDVVEILDGLGEMEFAELVAFNDGHAGAFWSGPPTGTGGAGSPWEMHPTTDEFLMCVDGSVQVQVLDREPSEEPLDTDLTTVTLAAGQFVVVPRGHWHRHHAVGAFREFYITPGPSEHSAAADPR